MREWTSYLPGDVENRLDNCRSTKSDIQVLTNARWLWMKKCGKDKEGFTKEDALVYVLDLLDCNSQYFDLTKEEYDELCREFVPPRRDEGTDREIKEWMIK